MKAVSTKFVPILSWPNNENRRTKSPLKGKSMLVVLYMHRTVSNRHQKSMIFLWRGRSEQDTIKILKEAQGKALFKKKKHQHLQATFVQVVSPTTYAHTHTHTQMTNNQKAQFCASLSLRYKWSWSIRNCKEEKDAQIPDSSMIKTPLFIG